MKYAAAALTVLTLLAGGTSCKDNFEQPPVVIPEGGIGNGDWDNPLTAYQAMLGTQIEGKSTVWVTGYIVGWIDTSAGNRVMFTTPAEIDTNMAIAMDPEETDPDKCVSVQLPSGSVRSALNLSANPGNKGKMVTIKGTTGERYCGIYGVKSVSAFNWGDKGIYEEPIEPVVPVGQLYCDFDKSSEIGYYTDRGWTNAMERGALSGWYIRSYSGNNYATVSATNGTQFGGPYVNWLITPPVDMDQMETKTLTFRTQGAYGHDDSSLEVYALTTNDQANTVAVKLDAAICTPNPDGATPVYSDWKGSGKVDLSQFTGIIYIGFKYTAAKGGMGFCSTYCVDDVNVGDAPTEDVVDPSEQVKYRKATAVESGKEYLIVSDGKVAAPLTGNYGYISVRSAEETDGVITMNNNECSFTFTSSGEGFTICQSDGRYLLLTGTYNSFNVSADRDAEGTVFTVAPQTDGTFIITNVLKNKSIQFSTQFGNFGCYADKTGNYPVLYQRID